MTSDSITSDLVIAHDEEREIVLVSRAGDRAVRGLVVAIDADGVRLLCDGDARAPHPIPIVEIVRVRVLGPTSSAGRDRLREARRRIAQ